MGRGLSPLQRCILNLAVRIRKCRTADWKPDVDDVLRAEVMTHFYGFQPTIESCGLATDKPYGRGGLKVHLRGWHGYCYRGFVFSVPEIGDRRYKAAGASIARALRRLAERGLIECYESTNIVPKKIKLTPEGWAEAEGKHNG